jgi:hypothetical protein
LSRLAQVVIAALICTGLAACDHSGSSGASAAASSGSGSATGSIASATDKSVTLSWNPPTENSNGTSLTNLAGYTLHYGTTPQDYTGSIEITDPTQTSYVLSNSNFPAGTYYFAISAYNQQQVSSSFSGEVSVTVD